MRKGTVPTYPSLDQSPCQILEQEWLRQRLETSYVHQLAGNNGRLLILRLTLHEVALTDDFPATEKLKVCLTCSFGGKEGISGLGPWRPPWQCSAQARPSCSRCSDLQTTLSSNPVASR